MDDSTLIIKIAEGDTQALRLLVEKNKNLVWYIIHSMNGHKADNEDLFQDVFLRVIKGCKNFRADSKLSTWVGSIAHHVCIDHLRKRKRESSVWDEQTEVQTLHYLPEEPAYNAGEKAELHQLVLSAIDKLPADYRTIITLYHLEECSYRDIAEIMGMPEGTVKSYISRARKLLREFLTNVAIFA